MTHYREIIHTIKTKIKTRLVICIIVVGLLITGLSIVNYCITDFGNLAGIFLLSIVFSITDLVPAIGLILPMMVWAVLAFMIKEDIVLTVSIIVVCFSVMSIKQILEWHVAGKGQGISAFEEIASSFAGFVFLKFNVVGLLAGPVLYTIGKFIYKIYKKYHK